MRRAETIETKIGPKSVTIPVSKFSITEYEKYRSPHADILERTLTTTKLDRSLAWTSFRLDMDGLGQTVDERQIVTLRLGNSYISAPIDTFFDGQVEPREVRKMAASHSQKFVEKLDLIENPAGDSTLFIDHLFSARRGSLGNILLEFSDGTTEYENGTLMHLLKAYDEGSFTSNVNASFTIDELLDALHLPDSN